MLRFKRGDTVNWSAQYKVGGEAVDLTSYNIASQIRTRDGALICALTITKLNQTAFKGRYTLSIPPATSAQLKPGSYFQDIQYTVGGEVRSTASSPVIIDVDQTQ